MSDEEHIASVVREADEWLNSHKVTETWRTMNRLRDTLVRTADKVPRKVQESNAEGEVMSKPVARITLEVDVVLRETETLEEGYEAYLAVGPVRAVKPLLLGNPRDLDYCDDIDDLDYEGEMNVVLSQAIRQFANETLRGRNTQGHP